MHRPCVTGGYDSSKVATMANQELIAGIRSRLHAAADPVRAAGSQAYMKSDMPALGVRVPEVRRITASAAAQWPCGSFEELRGTVLRLWRSASYREERYAAIDLTGSRLARGRLEMLPVYEEIIRTGAWWDLVDGVAPRIRALLQVHRPEVERVLRSWSSDHDMWIRRADREFFIRKAIGWALREYAKTNPDWVGRFAGRHEAGLSALSRREALRNLPQR